jgi:HK97 family phage major capsid protein
MSAALKEARERAEAELLKLADVAEERQLTDDEKTQVATLKSEIEDLRSREALQAETADLRNRSVSNDAAAAAKPASANLEVRAVSPYGDESGESWFADYRTCRDRYASDAEVSEARERMQRHYESVKDEGGARQVRALSSTTEAEGGYLVAPAHLQSLFARYLVSGATVTQLVSKMPLPPKTDQINLPKQDGAVAVAQHTQNNDLTETSATFTTVQATVYRYGGAQTIPNFLLERSLPGVDEIVLADLGRQLANKVDTDLINGTTPEGILNADGIGTATATAGTATMTEVWPALVNAVADVQAAHYASPDAIVMHPRRWAWFIAQIDGDKRPLVAVNGAPVNPVAGYAGPGAGSAPEGLAMALPVGSVLGIPVYLDSNIPTNLGAGTDEDRIIVGVFREAMLFQSAPQFGLSAESAFKKDQTIVRVTQDVAFTAERYPGAFSVISGTALNDTA